MPDAQGHAYINARLILIPGQFFSVVVSLAASSTNAEALSRSAVFAAALAPRTAVALARLEGQLGEILTLRSLGAPVQLADGTLVQRYTVVANVPFAIVPGTNASDDIRVSDGEVERPLSEFAGTPGFHAEIRVRSVGQQMVPQITLESRAGASSAERAEASRRGDQ